MNCTNCGCEIQEGNLYCEKCGQEIRFVPDFDLEVENSIHETLSTLVEDISEKQPGSEKEAEGKKSRTKLYIWLCIAAAALVCIGVSVRAGVIRYQENSYDHQLKQAKACASNGNFSAAIVYMNRALELNGEDVDARLLLAEYYIQDGDSESAMQALKDVLARDSVNEQGYIRLIALYEAEQDYEAIERLLENSGMDELKEQYRRYLALDPEFSEAEGSYTEVIALKLSSNTTGNIYYTLDGSEPNERSERYITPIMLESGEYDVAAVFINEYGNTSDVVRKHYNIEVAVPLAPEVSCMSGSYDSPTMITVQAAPGETIYYTMDGSVPTMDSIPYSMPIAMPLGSSNFQFIAYSSEGIASEVTSRNYLLQVDTAIDVATAVNLLMQELKDRGVILEFDGSVPGKSGKNVYIASTLVRIGENDFFLIAEYYQDTLGTLTRTGSLYGVEAGTGAIYRVTTDGRGNYLANPY